MDFFARTFNESEYFTWKDVASFWESIKRGAVWAHHDGERFGRTTTGRGSSS